MDLKLSIIIPAFNVSQYIVKCLNSLTNQDILPSLYEIIVIDDGSTDDTLNILCDLKERISNLIVINQYNSGQSEARNRGLDLAKGKYIMFIDSDDYITENCLNRLLTLASDNNLDALQFNYYYVPGSNQNPIALTNFKGLYYFVYNGENYLKCHCGIWSSCLYIYKSTLFVTKKHRFLKGITSEDIELLPRLFFSCQRIMAIKDTLYFYVFNPKSTSKNREPNIKIMLQRTKSQFIVLENSFDFIENSSMELSTKEHLIKEVIQPTFSAGCTMLFRSDIPFSEAWKIHSYYIRTKYFPVRTSPDSALRLTIMYSIMNSTSYFLLFYCLGIKYLYFKIQGSY